MKKTFKTDLIIGITLVSLTVIAFFAPMIGYLSGSPDSANFSFDYEFTNYVFYTGWTLWLTVILGVLKILNYKKKQSINVDNFETIVIQFNIVSIIVFWAFFLITRMSGGHVMGWDDNMAEKFKSIIEHLLVPIILIVYFLAFHAENRGYNKKELLSKSHLSLWLPIAYICLITIRYIVIGEGNSTWINQGPSQGGEPQEVINFPYDFIRPGAFIGYANGSVFGGWTLYLLTCASIVFAHWVMFVGMKWTKSKISVSSLIKNKEIRK